jgi:hypothetical protein
MREANTRREKESWRAQEEDDGADGVDLRVRCLPDGRIH